MNKPPRILIGPSSFGAVDPTPLKKLKGSGLQVIDNPFKRRLTRDELLELLAPDVVGLIAGLEPLDRDVLAGSRLRVISRCGSGLSNVDLAAAAELGITVRSTPTAPVTAVAELVVGALLILLRALPAMDRALHDRSWDKRIGEQLSGKTVAVVGFGRIGRRVSRLLKAFDADVIVVDPAFVDAPEGFPLLDLDRALELADVVTLHCSGEQCLIGDAQFRKVKRGSYVVNAARGGLVDEEALIRALDEGRVAGAYLDTFGTEPYQGRLCEYDQVLLTPHIGSYTVQCRRKMEAEAVDNLLSELRSRIGSVGGQA